MSNDKEREACSSIGDEQAFEAWFKVDCPVGGINARIAARAAWKARASLAASAGSQSINGQLYTALNNLFSHLGMEGCVTADHAFVWDAMTALKRIDGGVHLDNLAVSVDPDAHRDDMLAAVQLLEGGEWAEHFAKTPIGMRLEDQITRLHNEVAASAGSEPVAPSGWREAIGEIRAGLEESEPSGYDNSGYRAFAGTVLDAVEDALTALVTNPTPPEERAPAAPPMDGEIALIEKALQRAGITSLLNHGAASCVFSEGCEGVSQEHLLAYTREIALHCALALAAGGGREAG